MTSKSTWQLYRLKYTEIRQTNSRGANHYTNLFATQVWDCFLNLVVPCPDAALHLFSYVKTVQWCTCMYIIAQFACKTVHNVRSITIHMSALDTEGTFGQTGTIFDNRITKMINGRIWHLDSLHGSTTGLIFALLLSLPFTRNFCLVDAFKRDNRNI